ncbi:hypothetical protein OG808_03725 [Streptomyces sp. NBC_01761]|uniref:hypothetical protein n=1 Tax=Streptomyces sp. NBC_01761 TaxID=2975932 RepID=UPI002DDC74F3|nr:hypothetical protein [Streptomyces sp. NBC_01761]WSC51494.1 hypothetical protein OG808_03725 [Streptomyces sp. NBC_01761]
MAANVAPAGAGLPGAPVFAGAAALVAAAALTVGLRACGRPESTTDWRTAIRAAAHDAARDLPGTGLVLLAATTRFLCTCMLLPPGVPGTGSAGARAGGDRRTASAT